MAEKGKAFDWNSTIEKESTEFEPLPDGIYEFRVTNLERGSFNGSETMEPCPRATLTLACKNVETGREGNVFDRILLNEKFEWKLSAFFKSIGFKLPGVTFTMNWDDVEGSTGKCEIETYEYTDRNGNARKTNQVKRYMDKEQPKFVPGKF